MRRAAVVAALAGMACTYAQPYEQGPLRAGDNFAFRREYPGADRLFNAFDYGHAVLSETLLQSVNPGARLDGREFAYITSRLLREPPALPLEERAIAPAFALLAPEAIATFEWAHELHRQFYDIIAERALSPARRAERAREALRYYRSRRDLALSDAPKSMDLMEGQSHSLAFRRAAPRFNRLIWSYHWLQMGLYDALLSSDDPAARRRTVDGTVERFFVMHGDALGLPRVMPMSAAVAPRFSAAYPEAAIIFDNLHALHDVVSDILATPTVPASRKRAEILRALGQYRDSTSFVTSRRAWLVMSHAMGVDAMGGRAGLPD